MADNMRCGKILALNETQEDRILEALAKFRQDIMEEMKSLRQMMKETFDKSLISLQSKDSVPSDETDPRPLCKDEEEDVVPSLQETFNNITGILASCDRSSWSLSSKQEELFFGGNTSTSLSTSSDCVREDISHCSDDHVSDDVIGKVSKDVSLKGARSRVFTSPLNDPIPNIWSPLPNRATNISLNDRSKLYAYQQTCPRKVGLVSLTPSMMSEPGNDPQSLDNLKSTSRKIMNYKCKTCGKSFTRRSNLNDHIRTHTGYKPFKCTVCDKSFITHTSLKNHTRTHTGEKPYSCLDCGKTFAVWSNFRVHVRIHTGERPYTCELCNKSFTYLNSYKRHMRRLHTELVAT